ncbi:hypothetical protein LEN26_017597 [Aphanomyces euteiches]|nr:hypothetical protein LEN26_017597 [Aphanomyces euteiches]KAH9105996.1 hypothetical protein AeMF1_018291 [Aphanomyces euteiches]KAH9196974.1 hypothetical protein AeNC1_001053 [Aphanomyces euteiches]
MSAASAADTRQVEKITLREYSEFRFEVHGEDEVTIRLRSGTAELFGVELAKDKDYHFRKCQLAIFTFHGCELNVQGDVASSYTSDETPMTPIVNIHAQLDQIRRQALDSKSAGPRVLITGPSDTGKSTVSRILLNYALRMAMKPTFVDLDVAHGSLSVPGTIAATPLEMNCLSVEDEFILTAPLAYFYGHAEVKENPELYKYQVSELAKRVDERLANDAEVNASGVIINTCNWIDSGGYQVLLHSIQAFHVDLVIVLGQDKLCSELQKDLSSSTNVIKLPRSDGVVQRSSQQRHQLRMDRFHEYFYGKRLHSTLPMQSPFEFSPHSAEVDLDEINVYRIQDLSVSNVMLPVGQVHDMQRLRVLPADKSSELNHCMAAVSHPPNAKADNEDDEQLLLSSSAAGFVLIKSVNVATGKMTLLVPCPGPLPSKNLIVGTLKFME